MAEVKDKLAEAKEKLAEEKSLTTVPILLGRLVKDIRSKEPALVERVKGELYARGPVALHMLWLMKQELEDPTAEEESASKKETIMSNTCPSIRY